MHITQCDKKPKESDKFNEQIEYNEEFEQPDISDFKDEANEKNEASDEKPKMKLNLAENVYQLHLYGSALVQHNFPKYLKDFDVRTKMKADRYTKIYDQILQNHNIKVQMPPEYVLAAEVTTDLMGASMDRIISGLPDSTKKKIPTVINEEAANETQDGEKFVISWD